MSILHGTAHAVIDVEGNGQNPPDIIEIAVVPIDNDTIGEVRSWLVRPPTPINPVVTRKVHGISNTDVASCPTWTEIQPHVLAALKGRTPVAHNAHVEYQVLRRHMPNWEPAQILDTIRLAKATWPNRKGAGGYGLDALLEHTNLTNSATNSERHRAGFDAHATARLFAHLAELQATYQSITELAAVPGIGQTITDRTDPQDSLW